MPTRIKICGLTTQEAVEAAFDAGADYVGFVFYPKSPRHVSIKNAAELANSRRAKVVAVTVNPSTEELREIVSILKPDYIQLHGNESPEQVKDIKTHFGIPVIKAISVRSSDDIASARKYEAVADLLMFDAKSPGSGESFDWNLLRGREFSKPWFLSGGLNAENVAVALRITGAPMVDVSSSVESAPGVKDVKLIKEFIRAVKLV